MAGLTMAARYVLDASALLCLLNDEAGAARVAAVLDEALLSAVNYSEVVARIVDRGGTRELVAEMLDPLHLRIVDFDACQAAAAAMVRPATRGAGLSLGDRACLALAAAHDAVALTADQAWAALDLPIASEQIR